MESYPGERRVALVPMAVPPLVSTGLEVLLAQGAGMGAGFPDSAYEGQGASIAVDRTQLFSSADILLCVHGLDAGTDATPMDLELSLIHI